MSPRPVIAWPTPRTAEERRAERAALRSSSSDGDAPPPREDDVPAGPRAEPFRTIRADRIDIAAEPRWLVRGLVPAGACSVLAGEAKSGKSWLADDLAVSVASATPFLGCEVVEPGPVLYVALEDATPAWGARIDGLCLARGRERAALEVHVADVATLDLTGDKDSPRLIATVEALKAKLVVVDPLALAHRGDENSSSEIMIPLQRLRLLARVSGATVLLIHHFRKPSGEKGRRAHRVRGSSALFGWLDVLLTYEQFEKGEGCRLDFEARSFRAPPPMRVQLQTVQGPDGRARFWHESGPLEDDAAPEVDSLKDDVLAFLRERRVRSVEAIAAGVTRKVVTVRAAVRSLEASGQITKDVDGSYVVAAQPVPAVPDGVGRRDGAGRPAVPSLRDGRRDGDPGPDEGLTEQVEG